MEQESKAALKEFFSAQLKLNQLGIIHSRDYIGDIGKYLCQIMYNLELPKRGQAVLQARYDGMIGKSRIQVRINNCPIGTPVRLDESMEYDEVIVVLGPNCKLRPDIIQDAFIFYRFSREEALKRFRASSGGYIGGRDTFSHGYDKVLDLS